MCAVEKSQYFVEYLPTSDFEGKDVIAFVVKRTYTLDAFSNKLEIAEKQEPVLLKDEPNDDGDTEMPSTRLEAELVPIKPKADIVFLGKAYAPGGKPAPTFDCALRVGAYRKVLRIFGPRKCTYQPPEKIPKIDKKTGLPKEEIIIPPPLVSEPEPIAEVELRLLNAYGGWSYAVPDDPEGFEDVLKDIAKKEEEEKKAKEEAKKKKEEEEKKKAEEAKKKPDKFFSDAGGGDKALDPNAPPEEEAPKEAPKPDADVGGWGKKGTAGETRERHDGATQAIDLEALEAAEASEAAYRSKVGADAQDKIDVEAKDGSTRALLIDDNLLADDTDWAAKQREELLGADAKKKADAEKKRKEEAKAKEKPWPKLHCPQNPVGKGFALDNRPETLDGLELPLIEDPARLLRPEDIPRDLATVMDRTKMVWPAGTCFFPKAWWPRSLLAGVMPAEKEAAQKAVDEQVAKLDPKDPDQRKQAEALIDFEVPLMKPEYHNGAMPGLQVEKLVGDEEVMLQNLDKNGTTTFKLRGDYPRVMLDRGRGRERIAVRLDTLVIDREADKVALLWRGVLPYGGIKEFETYRKFDIHVADSDIEEYKRELEEQARARSKDGATQAIDISELEKDEYRAHVDAQAGAGAAEKAKASGAPVLHEGGTKAIDLAELGDEKVVTDDRYEAWVDDAKKAKVEEPVDEAEAIRKKKAELKKNLEAMKAKEEAEAAAAAAAAEEAAAKKKK